MDQASFWVIVGIIALVILTGASGFALWAAWQKTRSERLGNRGRDYRRIAPPTPEIPQPAHPLPGILWGDEEQTESEYTENFQDTGHLPHCPLCKQIVYSTDQHTCPSCEEKYHRNCWIEYHRTCVICGKEEA